MHPTSSGNVDHPKVYAHYGPTILWQFITHYLIRNHLHLYGGTGALFSRSSLSTANRHECDRRLRLLASIEQLLHTVQREVKSISGGWVNGIRTDHEAEGE